MTLQDQSTPELLSLYAELKAELLNRGVVPDEAQTPEPPADAQGPRLCLCGCGEVPEGQNTLFRMGHDAKLKSKVRNHFKDIPPEGLKYAEQNWPELFGKLALPAELCEAIVKYCHSHPAMFDTKPKRHYIPQLTRNIACWKSTRLKLLRDGIQMLRSPDDIAIQYIEPAEAASNGYEAGYFIISKRILQSVPQFKEAMASDSYEKEFQYHWPTPPEGMFAHFYAAPVNVE